MMNLIFLLLSLMAFAEEPEFEISVDQETYPLETFKSVDGAKVKAIPRKNKSPSAIPDKESREEAFAKVAGLAEKIRGFDELERDKLYVHARLKKLKELKKTYPAIPEKLLARLQKVLR